MKFEEALAAMRDGNAVRRKGSWWSCTIKDRLNGGKRVEVSADGQQYSAYTFEVFDIVEADDWEVAA